MDTFPSCVLNTGWPYFADENLEPDGSKGLQLDPFDQPTDTASTFSGSNTTYSPSFLLPLNHNLTSMSGSSANNSYFDPNVSPTKYPSTTTWDQSALCSVADNRDRSYSQQLPTNSLYSVNHGATSRGQSLSADHAFSLDERADAAYKNWQPSSPHRHVLDAGDQASYAPILEELNQMDASILVDSVVSSANSPDVHTYPPHSTKRTRPQSLRSDSYTSTSLRPVTETTLLLSPVSNDDRSPIAPKSAIAKKELPFKKSSIRAKVPHSAVEKKYRSNLNSKMIELQQCVPALHVKTNIEDKSRSLDSTTGSPKRDGKLPKGLILNSAADYIRTLEARTSELDTHIELLERRLVVLQRIALEKMGGADSGFIIADRKDKKSPEARKSSSISIAEASATGRARKSPNVISRQTILDADSKRPLSKVEKEQLGEFETASIFPPAKRRRVSRNKAVNLAVGSLPGLALWER